MIKKQFWISNPSIYIHDMNGRREHIKEIKVSLAPFFTVWNLNIGMFEEQQDYIRTQTDLKSFVDPQRNGFQGKAQFASS